jgi:hypothetical protein
LDVGAAVDLAFGVISTALGGVMLVRPTDSAARLGAAFGRWGVGAPSRAGMYVRGALFLTIGAGLLVIGWHFRHAP